MRESLNVVELALQLTRIPSPTGEENSVLEALADLAEQHQFTTKRVPVSNHRYNLLISPKRATEQILLTTHIDTVPGGPPAQIKGEKLFGRGSADAKGIAAAMFCALVDLVAEGHNDTSLLLLVGEETSSDGAKAAAAQLEPRRFFINGEPTEGCFVRAQRGAISAAIRTTGVSCHSGYPHLGRSAVHDLLDVLYAIRSERWPSDPVVGDTLVNVGTIAGGTAANVLAEGAQASLMIRVAALASTILDRLFALTEGRATLEIKSASDPQSFFVPENEKECIVGYGSDVAYLRTLGTPLMYGPGSIAQAHTVDEWVLLSELVSAQQKYKEIAIQLSKRGAS